LRIGWASLALLVPFFRRILVLKHFNQFAAADIQSDSALFLSEVVNQADHHETQKSNPPTATSQDY
jgi:hypothetical protein